MIDIDFFPKILFIFRKRGREGDREGEKHQLVASHIPPDGDLAHNPGMCPDWESNQRPFGFQAGAQSTEPHQPGLDIDFHFEYFLFYFLMSRYFIFKSRVVCM